MLARQSGHSRSAKSLASLLPAVLAAAAITIAAIVRIDMLSADLHNDLLATDARYELAVKAADAVRGALASEKDAMSMTGKTGLDQYAADWMTSIDHLRAATASIEMLAETPDEMTKLEAIWSAIETYVAVGEKMYRLKVAQRSDNAVAVSNSAAETARIRLGDLVQNQAEASAAERAAKIAGFQHAVAWILAAASLGLAAIVALAARIGPVPAAAMVPRTAGE